VGARDLTQGLPSSFVERLRSIVPGERWSDVVASFADPEPFTARVNTLKMTVEDAQAVFAQAGLSAARVPWLHEGLLLDPTQRDELVRHARVEDGCVYVQGASSWLPVMALEVEPGMEVLDLAAAPGGKASHVAARMHNLGRLACVEPIRGRFFRLKANLERAGVTCAQLYQKDGRHVGGAVPERFDRVLLDAPCSSEARFRAYNPDTFDHWSERKVKEASRKQRGLIRSAFQALKPGGRLVYATCSFAPEEGEEVVASLLEAEPSARTLPWGAPDGLWVEWGLSSWRGRAMHPGTQHAVRVLPGGICSGFFLAVIEKDQPGS
jgi:NOL1/NOP2/sun family putative RNA methylase